MGALELDHAILARMDSPGTRPRWETADALRLSLRHAGITPADMREHLGVSRQSMTNWLTARGRPTQAVLRAWAAKTDVPYEWLVDPEQVSP
ncbi:helix-turn-helix transcriptional regulator [Nocardia sp. NPDC050435]|uniref:helix-turn-helix domain-containing protein n=1 Tax=Nocardia sp. NPDC050435 TaxID=3155040 RepID=UPI0033C1BCBF